MKDEQHEIKNKFCGNLSYWKLNPKTDFALELHKQFLTVLYRGADKSLARPGRKQATATEDFDFHISYL